MSMLALGIPHSPTQFSKRAKDASLSWTVDLTGISKRQFQGSSNSGLDARRRLFGREKIPWIESFL